MCLFPMKSCLRSSKKIMLTGRKSILRWTGKKFVSTLQWELLNSEKKDVFLHSLKCAEPASSFTCLHPFLVSQQCLWNHQHTPRGGIQSNLVQFYLTWLGKGSALCSFLHSLAKENLLVLKVGSECICSE